MGDNKASTTYGAFGDWKSDICASESSASSRSSSFVSRDNSAYSLLDVAQCKGPRKLSAVPVSDPEGELRTEIEQSIVSHDCNLSALNLSTVPDRMPLSTLKKLCFAENTFTTLSESLFHGDALSHLVELDMNANELKSLPLALFYLPALEVLSLNTNLLTALPFEDVTDASKDAHGRPFLPSLRRVGIESNRLQHVPIGFLQWCPVLEELLLAMNEEMLSEPVPYTPLLEIDFPMRRVVLKMDNRPRLVHQMEEQSWSTTLPWLNVGLNKIYPDKVLDFLYLGSLRTAQTVTVYHDLDIGYVLTAGRDLEVKVEPGMKQLVLPVDDFPGQSMTPVFSEAFRFIDEARLHKKGILIHCFAGLSRSVTIAVAYVMNLMGITRDVALAMVRKARPAARPNDGFMQQLMSYEVSLRNADIIQS